MTQLVTSAEKKETYLAQAESLVGSVLMGSPSTNRFFFFFFFPQTGFVGEVLQQEDHKIAKVRIWIWMLHQICDFGQFI